MNIHPGSSLISPSTYYRGWALDRWLLQMLVDLTFNGLTSLSMVRPLSILMRTSTESRLTTSLSGRRLAHSASKLMSPHIGAARLRWKMKLVAYQTAIVTITVKSDLALEWSSGGKTMQRRVRRESFRCRLRRACAAPVKGWTSSQSTSKTRQSGKASKMSCRRR